MQAKRLGYRFVAQDRPLMDTYERLRKQAVLLKLSKRAKQKLEWFIYYHTKGQQNARKTIRYFGIGKTVFYKWLSVFDPVNLRALEESSRAPETRRTSTITRTEEDRILALRKANPEYGKMKLQVLYQEQYGIRISSWKFQLVIEKYKLQRKGILRGYSFRKQSISKRRIHSLRKEHRPGYLVAFDSIELRFNDRKVFIVTGIDTVSKVAWARAYSSHTSATTKDLFQRLYILIFGNIANVQQDNGSEFQMHFEALLASMDIPQYFSRVKTPKDNPVCERFNSTVKREFLRLGNMTSDLIELNRRLSKWLLKYNCYRPHQTLNYQTPIAYYTKYLQAKHLSAM